MRKFGLIIAAIAALSMSTAAIAAVNVSDEGVGFVGKGDVQLAFGWNNKDAQTKTPGVTFTHQSEDKYDVTCEWETETGGPRSKVIEHDVTIKKTVGVNANIAYDARNKKQITGYNLNGFEGTPVITGGSLPAVDDSCPMAHATAVVTEVTRTSSTGGLFVNHSGVSVPLPNTPVL